MIFIRKNYYVKNLNEISALRHSKFFVRHSAIQKVASLFFTTFLYCTRIEEVCMNCHLRKSLRFILFPFLGILTILIAEKSVAEPRAEVEIHRLRQSVQALNHVRQQASRELDEASAAGRFSMQDQHDYQTFIAFLGGRVGEYCRTLSLAGGPQAIAGLTCPGGEAGLPTQTAPAVKTTDEQIEALDATFTDLLGDFDEMLLKEQDRIAAHKPRQRESGEPGESGGSGGGGDFSGQGGEGTGSTGEGVQGEQAGESAAQGSIPGGGAKGSGNGVKGGSGKQSSGDGAKGGGGQSSASSGPSGQDTLAIDDDIVARQLREAAEKETDPELKEKLWEEYRKYKAGK